MTKQVLCCLVLTLTSFSQTASHLPESSESKLLVLEHLWNEAQLHRDSGALSDLISDRFVNTEFDGEVSDRSKFLAEISDPQFKPTIMTIADMKIDAYSQAAIVTGSYHAKGSYNGKPYEHFGRFTDTWVIDKGKWECVASHSSLVKK
jgi:ketosteroid isomerase-like protein